MKTPEQAEEDTAARLASYRRARRENLFLNFTPAVRAKMRSNVNQKLAVSYSKFPPPVRRMALAKLKSQSLEDFEQVNKYLTEIEEGNEHVRHSITH